MYYDKTADAMYIRIKKGKVHRTKEITDTCIVDIDKKGTLLGVELLFVSRQLPKREISRTARAGIPITTFRGKDVVLHYQHLLR